MLRIDHIAPALAIQTFAASTLDRSLEVYSRQVLRFRNACSCYPLLVFSRRPVTTYRTPRLKNGILRLHTCGQAFARF